MPKKVKVPDWFHVNEGIMAYIRRTTMPADQKIPNFALGGPMCCFVRGEDHQCDGNPLNCPPHLQKFKKKR